MSPRSQETFVYGTFLWPSRGTGAFFGEIGARIPNIALEILREFNASEFVGRLYTKPSMGSSWTRAQLSEISVTAWYKSFEKFHGAHVAFIMQGSGPWEVLHFRPESDESGPYVAVALRQFEKGKVPNWVRAVQKKLAL
jgi:hypothetical protein